jgi:ribonuclease-3
VSPAPSHGAEGTIEAALGYAFGDAELAERALAHPSWAYEVDGSRGNERLEFLGDAVLGLVIAELLYAAHPEWDEGQLTRARAGLVNQRALAARARAIGLGAFVKLGRTERRSAGDQKDTILANCLEALVGAVYLDGGLEPVRALARRLFGEAVERGAGPPRRDAKTNLQERAHAGRLPSPTYHTLADSGLEQDEQRFTVEVRIAGRGVGRGSGRSKRDAERAAAEAALAAGEPR